MPETTHHEASHDVSHDASHSRDPLDTASHSAMPTACGCGCSAGEEIEGGRKAVAVDPAIKERNLKRLRRIEGQVRGLQRMVEEDRYCADILTQISSVHEALRATGRELMRNHLRHCVASAVASGPEAAEVVYDELIELMYRSAR